MKSKFLLLGFVLIFLGVIVTSLYNALSESYMFLQNYTKTNDFQVSGNFTKGEQLILSIVPSDEWLTYIDWIEATAPPYNVSDYIDVAIQVDINNTEGQRTTIDLIYVTYAAFSGEQSQLMLYAAYTNFTSGGLVNIGAAGAEGGAIKGEVETSGTYTAKIVYPDTLFDLNIPPTSITLNRYVIKVSYPYRQVWPIGVVLIIFGGFSSFWARRQSKKQKLQRKKKTT